MKDSLTQANGRLKLARSRCTIEQRGEKLLLRGTFPAKPEAARQDWHRQRIFLGVSATPAGISYAEAEARKVSALLDQNLFSWEPWLKNEKDCTTDFQSVVQWVEKFKVHKFAQGISTRTWQDDYEAVFKYVIDLDPDKAANLVFSTKPNSRTRRRYCLAIAALFKFANIEIDLKPYQGNYSPTKVEPRDIPTDTLIQEWFDKIPNPNWRWAYGILSTYGIRPEELVLLDFASMPVLSVLGDKNERSDRRVYPIYPEWVEVFGLANIKPLKCVDSGEQCSKQFKRYSIPFPPYTLRHAWAIRSMEFGLPLELAAAQMGHSTAVHSQTYHRWISDRHHARAFEAIMQREDRLRPK